MTLPADTNKLLPCPFCGNAASLDFDPSIQKSERFYMIGCSDMDCIAFGIVDGYRPLEHAIEVWNYRALQSAQRKA